MSKGRMEAFSDGVIAILITIMVLDLQPPKGTDLSALQPLVPVFLSYIVSFALLGTYWKNHHHYLQAASVVDGRVLLANLHLLFWLSLFPFGTAWMGESGFAPVPTAVYAALMLLAGVAFYILAEVLLACQGQAGTLAAAVAGDHKGKVSPIVFTVAIPVALAAPPVAFLMCGLVALMWLIPGGRFERTLAH